MKYAVLDASAVVAFLDESPGAEKMHRLLTETLHAKLHLSMSVVNWGEVYYYVWRTRGKAAADKTLADLSRWRIQIVPADTELTKLAAQFRVLHRLHYADCFAAALAQQRNATLVTADREFASVQRAVKILWTT